MKTEQNGQRHDIRETVVSFYWQIDFTIFNQRKLGVQPRHESGPNYNYGLSRVPQICGHDPLSLWYRFVGFSFLDFRISMLKSPRLHH